MHRGEGEQQDWNSPEYLHGLLPTSCLLLCATAHLLPAAVCYCPPLACCYVLLPSSCLLLCATAHLLPAAAATGVTSRQELQAVLLQPLLSVCRTCMVPEQYDAAMQGLLAGPTGLLALHGAGKVELPEVLAAAVLAEPEVLHACRCMPGVCVGGGWGGGCMPAGASQVQARCMCVCACLYEGEGCMPDKREGWGEGLLLCWVENSGSGQGHWGQSPHVGRHEHM